MDKVNRFTKYFGVAAVMALAGFVLPGQARAELPAANVLLADLGFSSEAIASIESGKIAPASATAAMERDLAAGFAFFVKIAPAELVKDIMGGLVNDVDPNTLKTGVFKNRGSLEDLSALVLDPDSGSRVKRYLAAQGGDDLNLSTSEVAAFQALGESASQADVEVAVRKALLARVAAYQAKGLAGIASYDRGDGKQRDVSGDLKAMTAHLSAVKKYAPGFFALLSEYPSGKPEGTQELFRWMHFQAHGVPTVALVHGMVIPDGDAFLALQRQYYVSEGFNCEQAIAGFLPVQGGTVVIYANHTSTDQVSGFGGGAKRSIGSRLLASQLEGLFAKVQSEAPK